MITKLNQAIEATLSVVVTSATAVDTLAQAALKGCQAADNEMSLVLAKQEVRMEAHRATYASQLTALGLEL